MLPTLNGTVVPEAPLAIVAVAGPRNDGGAGGLFEDLTVVAVTVIGAPVLTTAVGLLGVPFASSICQLKVPPGWLPLLEQIGFGNRFTSSVPVRKGFFRVQFGCWPAPDGTTLKYVMPANVGVFQIVSVNF